MEEIIKLFLSFCWRFHCADKCIKQFADILIQLPDDEVTNDVFAEICKFSNEHVYLFKKIVLLQWMNKNKQILN